MKLLKKVIPSIVKKTLYGLYVKIGSFYRKYRILKYAKTYTLIKNPKDIFPVLARISDASWNKMYTPEIFGICKERTMEAIFPELEFYSMKNATISLGSDIILTEHGVWWDKYNEEDFMTLCTPADNNVISYTSDSIRILPSRKQQFICGKVISLTGVWSYAWSHCIFEFICRLFFAGEAGLLNQEVTLLTDNYHDENIEYIISNFLKNYPQVKWRFAQTGIDYKCEELMAIRCTGTNYNEAKVYWDYRLVIPEVTIRKIHEYIVDPIVEKIKNNPVKHRKVFLSRHSNRKLTNTEEVEKFFKEQGFYFVEGFELTLEEKVDLFYHAEEIVGLHSSAWQNIIFCNKVKCLMLVNNRYAPEMLFYTMAKENVQSWLNVCGMDVDDERRSDFYIPLAKIKEAYESIK